MAFILMGCNQVEIKDSIWYADMGDLGAAEFHFLKPGQKNYSKEEWDVMRFGMACTNLSNIIEIKGALEKLCKTTNSCTFEQIQALENLSSTLEKVSYEIQK